MKRSHVPNHAAELLNNILTVLLHADSSRVARRVGVHRTDNGRNRWLLIIASWWVGDVSAQENDRLVKHLISKGKLIPISICGKFQ